MEFMGAKARLRDNFRCMSSVASARLQDALCKIATLNIGLEDAAIYMVRRLAFPAPPPPPQWHGLAGGGGGGGGWPVRRVVWRVGWGAAAWVTERAGILSKPYASHKPYNVGRVPVLTNLNLYLIL